MSYLIVLAIGIVIGAGLTKVLLSESMLVRYNKTSNTVSDSYAAAKAIYKAEIYGTDTETEATENTESEDKEA